MNDLIPAPRKPKRYEYKASDCPKHGNRCAMRRERHAKGPFECVFCVNEQTAATLLAPQPDLAPAALSVTEQTPPAIPLAVEAAVPADDTERGGGAACSPLEQLLGKWPGDESDAELIERLRAMDIPSKPLATMAREPWERVRKLSVELRHTVGVLENGDASADECGIELLRISNELATESKRLRSAPPSVASLTSTPPAPSSSRAVSAGPLQMPETLKPDGGAELSLPEVTPSGGAEAHERDDAYAAIERYHARQQPNAAPDLPPADEVTLPSGWQREHGNHATCFVYGSDTSVPIGAHPVVFYDEGNWNKWCWQRPGGNPFNGRAPSMLAAMCEALGLTVTRDNGGAHGWVCRDVQTEDGYFMVHAKRKTCQRWALERYHARQQPASAPADDACVCTYRDDGHRDVSRFCTLHGAYWQTLAEQRSELHEDGTPRAGCGYCASTPELDARERGL